MNEDKPTGIEALVCQDIAARQKLGIQKYGRPLADNPASLKERLQHAYEECLDQAAYLKWAIVELEKDPLAEIKAAWDAFYRIKREPKPEPENLPEASQAERPVNGAA